MDTRPLERFATQARRDLISSVDARATAVLVAGSVARAERPEDVRRFEAEIAAHGRKHVIDKIAYTWFNRIIALRFMDARGYTDVGIVSPAQGQSHGQPEILAEAKRGNLDADVVNNKTTAETILGLLDGTRRSTDAEGEAYALLLTACCRYWHKSMPFMFEREGDYTELLVPAGLLADGAILAKVREVLTKEVCDDVEVIGWLYQFYISERKDEVFAGFKKNKKAGAEEIPAATQLFTPHWIVRYLVENSVGRLWMLNRPGSRLVDRMNYYIAPIDDETDFLRITGPEELTVIDPACGSGHMLTYAFDLLYAIYEEEGYAPSDIPGLILIHNLHGAEIDPRAGSLAAFALTMKARARQRTFFSKEIEPKVCVLEPVFFRPEELDVLVTTDSERDAEEAFWNQFVEADTLGSLIQPTAGPTNRLRARLAKLDDGSDILRAATLDSAARVVRQAEYLSGEYAAVVANPPYMDARNMDARLIDFLNGARSSTASGLDISFLDRAFSLVSRGGYVGFLTMDSWLSSFETRKFREELLSLDRLRILLHLGSGAFEQISGQVVRVVATILARDGNRANRITFLDAADLPGDRKKGALEMKERRFSHLASWFDAFPMHSLAPFRAPERVHDLYASGEPLSRYAEARTGLQTGDNERFVRKWHEVSFGSVRKAGKDLLPWAWYVKSTDALRWFSREEMVLHWGNDGEEIRSHPSAVVRNSSLYFRGGISFGGRGKELKARYVLPGAVFDQQNSMVFVTKMEPYFALGLLNSYAAEQLVRAASPSKFNIGAMKQIPVIAAETSDPNVESDVERAIEISRSLFDSNETSPGFQQLPGLPSSNGRTRLWVQKVLLDAFESHENLALIEARNDAYFADYFGIDTPREVKPDTQQPSPTEVINSLVSYAVGCIFGRYSLDRPGLILADQGATVQNYTDLVSSPTLNPDMDNVIPFVDDGWFEDDIVERVRQFLRVAFGPEHFEENLRFVEESLGVKTLRDYFLTKTGRSKFYDDHVQRYKKRPIYWMFSSPKGSFNALIYMHRYKSSTVSTVLNEYLREYRAKLEVALANADQSGAAGSSKDQKEADRLRKVLAELNDYEHDVLYPLATQQLAIDLDGGVKANYLKFYPALRKIAGLEAAE